MKSNHEKSWDIIERNDKVNSMKKRLGIVTLSSEVGLFYKEQLHNILGKEVELTSYSFENNDFDVMKNIEELKTLDTILVSTYSQYEILNTYIGKDFNIVIGKLTLSKEGFKTWTGGNIGTPLFSNIEEIKKEDKVVLELSSFQLMTMDTEVDVAVVTNITPNHLDMHKDMQEYIDAKKNILKYQREEDLLVINDENEITRELYKEAKGKVVKFSSKKIEGEDAYYKDGKLYVHGKEVCKKEDIIIKGMHNVENYLAAFLAVYDDVSIESMKNVAETFGGVQHRCEFVREIEGVKYYNDSIASSPTRTLAGLKAFEQPVILLAGGYDKHIPFEPLAYEGYEKIKAIVLFGATKEKIKDAFKKLKEEKGIEVPIYSGEDLEDVVRIAKEIAKEGDIITLSPACASFDMFKNFEIRGNKFKEIIKSI